MASAVPFANFFVILFPSMALRQAGIAVALQLILYGTNITGLREGRVRRLDKTGENGTP